MEREKVQLWKKGPYWATTNIGAEAPQEYGSYFWWGGTVGFRPAEKGALDFYGEFDKVSTSTHNPTRTLLEKEVILYNKNGELVLAPRYDAAHVNWGDGWRMPTRNEFAGLVKRCELVPTKLSGVNGFVARGIGDYAYFRIFLPCAGILSFHGEDLDFEGRFGHYWGATPYSDNMRSSSSLTLDMDYREWASYVGACVKRWYGFSIRPVHD